MRAGQLRRPEERLGGGLAIDGLAHALGGSVGGGGQRAGPALLEGRDQLIGEAISAQAGDSDFAAALDERAHQLDDARVVADGGADQADALGVRGDELKDAFGWNGAHAAVGGPAHHAVGAAARAAALRLDEEHRAQLGVGGQDLGAGGEAIVRHPRYGAQLGGRPGT